MAALSDYLESGLLHHLFRSDSFQKPSGICIALTSGVPIDSDTGLTIPELPSGIDGVDTGYRRKDLGDPSSVGDAIWSFTTTSDDDPKGGLSGVVGNSDSITFETALTDWGWVSGVAICDSGAGGNLLMHAELGNARKIYIGDSVKFDTDTLQISLR
jgi:hypothetical protein